MNFHTLGEMCRAIHGHPSQSLAVGVRYRNHILTVYLSAVDEAFRAFILQSAKAIDPDLPAHVVVEMHIPHEPHTM